MVQARQDLATRHDMGAPGILNQPRLARKLLTLIGPCHAVQQPLGGSLQACRAGVLHMLLGQVQGLLQEWSVHDGLQIMQARNGQRTAH